MIIIHKETNSVAGSLQDDPSYILDESKFVANGETFIGMNSEFYRVLDASEYTTVPDDINDTAYKFENGEFVVDTGFAIWEEEQKLAREKDRKQIRGK